MENVMHHMMTIVNNVLCYIWKPLRKKILKVLITRTKTFFFFFCVCVSIWGNRCSLNLWSSFCNIHKSLCHTFQTYSELYVNYILRKLKKKIGPVYACFIIIMSASFLKLLKLHKLFFFFLLLSKRKAIFQRKSSIKSRNRTNHFMFKSIPWSLLHLAIGVTQTHFPDSVLIDILPCQSTISLPLFQSLWQIIDAQPGTFREAKKKKTMNWCPAHRSMCDLFFVPDSHSHQIFSWLFPTWYVRPILPK